LFYSELRSGFGRRALTSRDAVLVRDADVGGATSGRDTPLAYVRSGPGHDVVRTR